MKVLLVALSLMLSSNVVFAKTKKSKQLKMSRADAKEFCLGKVDETQAKKFNKCVKRAMKKGKF